MIGLADGTVSANNSGLWFVILVVLAAVMGGSLWLRSEHQIVLAKILLWLVAAPGLLYALFLLMVVIGKPRWN
jgi:hypothetical protein